MPQKGTKRTQDCPVCYIPRPVITMKAKDLYESVLQLSPKERLRLAVMILNDMAADEKTIEYSDTWTEEDLQDLSAFALSHSENPHETETSKPKP